ncbi:hypothetical protein DFH06DRAFT_535551 [Mycena polygramma]|nr:hypothetical protein DFH06DRAFT_535551 [Mycena polygramma]
MPSSPSSAARKAHWAEADCFNLRPLDLAGRLVLSAVSHIGGAAAGAHAAPGGRMSTAPRPAPTRARARCSARCRRSPSLAAAAAVATVICWRDVVQAMMSGVALTRSARSTGASCTGTFVHLPAYGTLIATSPSRSLPRTRCCLPSLHEASVRARALVALSFVSVSVLILNDNE